MYIMEPGQYTPALKVYNLHNYGYQLELVTKDYRKLTASMLLLVMYISTLDDTK